jgi:hypothetical protein
MSRKRSTSKTSASPPPRKSLRLSSPKLKAEHAAREQFSSPISSESSPLSPPPDSDDLEDPFATTGSTLKENVPEESIDEEITYYEPPVTRSAAKIRTPAKSQRVHFQDDDSNSDSLSTEPSRTGIAFLGDLDVPFFVTDGSVFSKPEHSARQKAWASEYRAAEAGRPHASAQQSPPIASVAIGTDLEGSRASTPASFVSNTPSKRGRGNGRRGRGRGGRGGRGRGGGRAGRNEDSPEPPKKKIMTEAEREIVADLKARQTELKKFFKEVGAQQNDALSQLATRDLGRIAKKSKAHEKVPEYQELLNELEERKEIAQDFARRKYEYDLEQAKFLLEAEKEVIEQRCRVSNFSADEEGANHDLESLCQRKR